MRLDRQLALHKVWEASDCVPGVVEVLRELPDAVWARHDDVRALARELAATLADNDTDEDELVLVLERWAQP